MSSLLNIVIPDMQTQPGVDLGALRQEVVREQLAELSAAQAESSQPADEGVTDTSS